MRRLWALYQFWRQHRHDPGFRLVEVDTATGFWCERHGTALAVSTGQPEDIIAKIARHM